MSNTRRKLCVVTGSRAEYGLLEPVIAMLASDEAVELQLAVTGMHLAPEFGDTLAEIQQGGYPISARVEMLLSSDSAVGVGKSLGLGVIGFADAFDHLRPDIVVVLGDRFEVLAAVEAALIANVPVAHIAGGDTTEGAIDESIRHAITKMSHLHFVTNDLAARRVIQMGEDPGNVHVVGSPGLDNLRRLQLLNRAEIEDALGRKLCKQNLLVTFHPVTLEPGQSEAQLDELLAALESLGPDLGLFVTYANADVGGRALNSRLERWASAHDNSSVFHSMGQLRYLSLMAQVDAVVGNSSSGLYEAPSLRRPTVDIGERQRGRLGAASVIRCPPRRDEILAAIKRAVTMDCSAVVNPYGDGHSAERIVRLLKAVPDPRALLKKRFHAIEVGRCGS